MSSSQASHVVADGCDMYMSLLLCRQASTWRQYLNLMVAVRLSIVQRIPPLLVTASETSRHAAQM